MLQLRRCLLAGLNYQLRHLLVDHCQLGDVGVDDHGAAFARAALIDQHPAIVAG